MRLAIDFGTTKVSVACLTKKGEPYVLNLDSGGLVPSGVFLQRDGSLLVGKAAERQAAFNPINYIHSYKLKIGVHKRVLGTYTAADLVTEFLRYLHGRILNDAALRKESIEGVVLTCPVAFSPVQRELLIQAAKDAGFPEVELVSEPEAAGRAFCHYCAKSAFKERALVVDWGGGTFDVALVNRRTQFKVSDIRHTAGDNSMGGDLFDLYLTTYVLENLPDDVDSRLVPWFELTSRLRALKCRLSNQPTASFSMTVCSRHISVQITREEFEKLIHKEVQKAAGIVKQLLDSLHSNEQPEMLVLVGGTALIPSLRQELEKVVQLPVHTWMEARQAVVKGAALMCKEQAPMVHKGKSWLFYTLLFAVYVALLLSGIVLESDDALVWAFLWLGILPVLRLLYFRKLFRLIWFAPLMLVLSFVVTAVFNGFVPALRTWYTELNFPLHEPSGLRIVKGYLDPGQVDILLQSGYPIDTAERGEPLLFWAARHGCSQGVELLCSKGAGVNIGVNGDTPLHVATLNNHAPCVEILVSYGADTKLCNAPGKTAYDLACDLEMMEISAFLELYTDEGRARFLQEERQQKNPSLCASLEQGDLKQFRLYLCRGAPVNMARSKDGMTPLHLATQTNCVEAVNALVSVHDIDVNKVNKDGDTPLHVAARGDAYGVLEQLLSTPGIDVNKGDNKGETPLHIASKWGADAAVLEYNTGVLEMLLSTPGIDVNKGDKNGETPLHVAAREYNTGALEMLLSTPGIDVNKGDKNGETPLHVAAREYNTGVLEMLLSTPGIDVNKGDKNGETPLYVAAREYNTGVLEMLLSTPGIDVNKGDKYGETPLLYAIGRIHFESLVKLLLAAPGIDVNIGDMYGNTPLHYAMWQINSEALVKLLLAAPGIDVNKGDKDGETPLHEALKQENSEALVKLLLAIPGIDVNIANKEGNTPLHVAVSKRKLEVLKLLLSVPGINLDVLNEDGDTPLQLADVEAAKQLREHGAEK